MAKPNRLRGFSSAKTPSKLNQLLYIVRVQGLKPELNSEVQFEVHEKVS
jgi:hypothetical protein